MKRYSILVLICLCLLSAGCAGNMTATDPSAQSAAPTPSIAPAANPEAPPPLTPKLLMDALISNRDPQYAGYVRFMDITEVLESYGETQFSAFLRRRGGSNDYLGIDETLLYENTFVSGNEDVPFAVILFNEHRNGYGLVLENRDGWQFTGHFECGEVERSQHSDYVGVREPPVVGTHTARLLDDGSLQTWLQVPGHVESGTGRVAYDCTWYNLNSRQVDVRYITQNIQSYAPFCYWVTSKTHMAEEFSSGGYPLEIDYICHFAMMPEPLEEWSDDHPDDIVIEKIESFFWEDGGMLPISTYQMFYNQKDVSPGMFMDLAWDQFRRLERRGTPAEKEWAKQIRELRYEAMVDHVTLENIYGDRREIGQRKDGMLPQEFEEMQQLAPTMQTPGGAPVKLTFIDRSDKNFTLTRYNPDGSTTIIPIDNGMFNAHQQKGTAFYTLETAWFFGNYVYGFKVCATEDGKAMPFLPVEEAAAIERARGYLKEITGYEFAQASATATLLQRSEIYGTLPGEWDVSLLLPHQNMTANVRFELNGQMTFYALGALGTTDNPDTSLPLLLQPIETEALSYTEKAGYWYKKLPIKRMGGTRIIEQAAKNRPGQYENSLETITKQRFEDGSVLTSHFDQKTGRLTYFCLYPAEVLKRN